MASSGFQRLVHGHQDLVLAVDYNLYGTRMVTASSDHRLRVRERDEKTGLWNLVDVWTAHDAEVTDVKWNAPFVGEHIASIGEDGFIRVWQEDVNQVPNSGRRFTYIFERQTDTGLPYMSLDFKNIGSETHLAVITRDGFLSIFEPEDFDDLSSWHTLWSEQVCEPPPRTEESSFRLSWHKEKLPAWPAVLAGLDRRSLSLAVSIGGVVKVFRTGVDRVPFLAATLDSARDLILDVSWANGSMRGFDIIATVSKDGFLRIYELHTPGATTLSTSARSHVNALPRSQTSRRTHGSMNGNSSRSVRSGIGAGLANGERSLQGGNPAGPDIVKQDVKLVAELEMHGTTPWRVGWSDIGDVVVCTGDDGSIRFWKKAIDGKWLEAAEVDALKTT